MELISLINQFAYLAPGVTGDGTGMNLIEIFREADIIVQSVLVLLLAMSVMSWGIIVFKVRLFRRAERENELFLERFWESRNLGEFYSELAGDKKAHGPPVDMVFRSAYLEFSKLKIDDVSRSREVSNSGAVVEGTETIERAIKKAAASELSRLERFLSFLATTGSTAPFIGLFGTVWGIMIAFRRIGQTGSASLAVVAPGISEALIATAVGLFAAIPAVIAYNHFVSRLREVNGDLDSFATDLLNLLSRYIWKKRSGR